MYMLVVYIHVCKYVSMQVCKSARMHAKMYRSVHM